MANEDLMGQFLSMSQGGGASFNGDSAPTDVGVLDADPSLPPEMQNPQAPEDQQLVTGLVDIGGGVKVARGIAEDVIDIENRCGVECIEGYRDPATNARRSGTAAHSFHQLTENGHGAADFVGPPRALQNALAHAQKIGAVEADVHNDGRGQVLHVAW